MAGACVGFLSHNRYKASVFMGDTGSLALGGALAAMAACTGMFFPLFISSGIFVLEALSVIMQVILGFHNSPHFFTFRRIIKGFYSLFNLFASVGRLVILKHSIVYFSHVVIKHMQSFADLFFID